LTESDYFQAKTWVERYAPEVMTTSMRNKEGFKIQSIRVKPNSPIITEVAPRGSSAGDAAAIAQKNFSKARKPESKGSQVISIAETLCDSPEPQNLPKLGTQDKLPPELNQISSSVDNTINIMSTSSDSGGSVAWTPINRHGPSQPPTAEDSLRPFLCNTCGRRFAWELTLKYHYKKSHECLRQDNLSYHTQHIHKYEMTDGVMTDAPNC
jgi:hypothetical protein